MNVPGQPLDAAHEAHAVRAEFVAILGKQVQQATGGPQVVLVELGRVEAAEGGLQHGLDPGVLAPSPLGDWRQHDAGGEPAELHLARVVEEADALVVAPRPLRDVRDEELPPRAEQLADPTLADIPVIAYSGDTGVAQAAADLRVRYWFQKPVNFGALLEAIASFCPDG